MEVKIHRKERVGDATIGELWVEGTLFRCYVLEDVERTEKIKTKTAIPTGRYKLRLSNSPRFGRVTLEVLEVPNFEGVRIHAGNTAEDTWGCPLIGWTRDGGRILRSRACEVALTALALQLKENDEDLWLTITSDLQPIDLKEIDIQPQLA